MRLMNEIGTGSHMSCAKLTLSTMEYLVSVWITCYWKKWHSTCNFNYVFTL